ncbi:MAG: winged helix-turn-helix domain-containing protein [Ilumatobacteraceae bacterium]
MIEVLGDIRGWGPGVTEPVRITSPNQRIVLAVLVARHPDVVSVHDLVAAVWEDEPPASAARTVGSYVSRLRNVMGDAIAIVPGGYRLVLDDDLIDIRRYEQLVRAARTARGTGAIARYRDADRLWRGAPFAELTDAAAVTSEVVRLETVRLDAQDRLAAELLARAPSPTPQRRRPRSSQSILSGRAPGSP